ncbi:LIM and SH3 domain protein Lasp-like isoform X14 [Pecten maximus]|uniref:LIM and SH3 domain protein Lasp-like isoform X14 n=1 Tax=Pecten maximus TaxID=6579 RepID=UPI00145835FF|nr:LIM and SH3 domain protein Lasp-like isoform X14 [Pecten maximus]
MSKQCAKCSKTVFPVEELKCLDKVWHKGCFRCQECGMTLNMKNYKGYNKLPYCNAHYPKTTHTVVADTPESRRIAENTKIQSNVQYHSDFERRKGTYTQVPDTVDMKRLLLNTQNLSSIQYHKDFEMTKDQFTPVVDTPDLQRVRDNTKNISLIEYQKEFTTQRGTCNQICDTVEMRTHFRNTDNFSTIKYHAEFEKTKGAKISIADDPETKRVRKNMETISNVSYHGDVLKRNKMEMNRPVEQEEAQSRRRPGSTGDHEPRGRQPGSISDYDPTANKGGTPYSQRQSQGTAVYDSRTGVVQNGSHGRKVGSISDYDPVNEKYGSIAGQYSVEDTTFNIPPVTNDEDIPTTNTSPVTNEEEFPTTNTPSVTKVEEQFSSNVPPLPDDDNVDLSAEKDAISAQEEDPKMEIHFATPVRMTPQHVISPVENDIPPPYDPPAPPTEESISQSENYPLPGPPDDLTGGSQPQQARQPAYQPQQQQQQQPYRPPGQPQRNQVKYKALYDYTAADDDEVSFREDDYISNCEIIDAGWMEGTVERTGQRGMLPSNYVEKTS